ncbi:MAG: hypothetical protein IT288_09965 [Bdellovibrionales bacterium]|nr:hypothetical protein [Bdellovibrionales bacterium]
MTKASWITLNDYSIKYKVSASTLRRRIKDKTAEFRFDDGKYWFRDLPLKNHSPREANKASIAPPQGEALNAAKGSAKDSSPLIQELPLNQGADAPSQVWSTAQALLQEIKKAYMIILQEKEEQILQLKEEVIDLKTLVRVLEQNNEHLLGATNHASAADESPTGDWAFSLDK